MQLREDALSELIAIFKECYGRDLTKAEATGMTHQLMNLFELLSRPLPTDAARATRLDLEEDGHQQIGFRTSP